jgi:hypothetical protein
LQSISPAIILPMYQQLNFLGRFVNAFIAPGLSIVSKTEGSNVP